MKTDEELKQIAQDIHKGLIFSIGHIENPADTPSVFMPLHFMSDEAIGDLAKKEPFIYEYLDKASPRSVNGLPVFISFQYLVKEETKKMNGYYNKIKQAVDIAIRS